MGSNEESVTGRRGPGWRHVFAAIAATAVLTGGVTAFAADQFADVPESNLFHDQIGWMADTGITGGCGGGNFCPDAAVNRAQMSAFMQRLYNLQAGLVDVKSVENSTGATDSDPEAWTTAADLTTTVTIPPGTTGRLHTSLTGDAICNGGTTQFVIIVAVNPTCEVRFRVNNGAVGVTPSDQAFLDSDLTDAQLGDSGTQDLLTQTSAGAAEASTAVLGPGTYTVQVQLLANSGSSTARVLTFDLNAATARTEVLLQDA